MVSIRTKIKLPISYGDILKRLEMLDEAFRKANPDLFEQPSNSIEGSE